MHNVGSRFKTIYWGDHLTQPTNVSGCYRSNICCLLLRQLQYNNELYYHDSSDIYRTPTNYMCCFVRLLLASLLSDLHWDPELPEPDPSLYSPWLGLGP